MTLLFDQTAKKPQLHAQVIGVGSYEHLIGGTGLPIPSFPMSQLGSPVPSALAVLDWIKTFQHPTVTLGSVAALLSPSRPLAAWNGTTPDEAVINEIIRDVASWFDRCNQHPDNIALFYFCGHGLMRTGAALLAQDFGATPLNPFDQAIDFDALLLGMGRCVASTQLYFVDACQQSHSVLREQLALNARVPVPPDVNAPPRSDHLVLYAAAPLEPAYGTPNQPSRFTAALLTALRGLGARKQNGRWSVTTANLGNAVVRTVQRLCRTDGAPLQKATPGGGPRGATICAVEPPRVPFVVDVRPVAASQAAQLAILPGPGAPALHSRVPPGPWELEVDAGVYSLLASFEAATGFQNITRDQVFVLPPDAEEIMEVV